MGCGITKISVDDPNVNEAENERQMNNKDSNKPQSDKMRLGPDDTITDRANLSGDFEEEVGNPSNSQNTSQSESQIEISKLPKHTSDIFPQKTSEHQENSNFLLTYSTNFTTFNVDFMDRSISPECPFTIPLKAENLPSAPLEAIANIFSHNQTIQNETETPLDSYDSMTEPRSQQFQILSSRQIINRYTPEELLMLSENESNEIDLSSTLIESNPIHGIRGTGDNYFEPSGLSFD